MTTIWVSRSWESRMKEKLLSWKQGCSNRLILTSIYLQVDRVMFSEHLCSKSELKRRQFIVLSPITLDNSLFLEDYLSLLLIWMLLSTSAFLILLISLTSSTQFRTWCLTFQRRINLKEMTFYNTCKFKLVDYWLDLVSSIRSIRSW